MIKLRPVLRNIDILDNPPKWFTQIVVAPFPNLNYLKSLLTYIVILSQFEYLVMQKDNNGATKFVSQYSVKDTMFHIANHHKTSLQFAHL